MEKLLPYQIPHTYQMLEALQMQNVVLDASDTGTGKTYTTIAICKELGKKPFIICPKSVLHNWSTISKDLDCELFGLANYECLKSGKYYTASLEYAVCPYIDKIKNGEIDHYIFQFPEDVIVIFDEAHRCKNHKTSTSRLLLSAFNTGNKMIMLSATITDKIECFKPFGVAFGFYDEPKQYTNWMRRQLKMWNVYFRNRNISDDECKLELIHRTIFPAYGSRMKIKELGDLFPHNQVVSQCYFLQNHEEVDKLYKELNLALQELKIKELRAQALGKIIRIRQRIEILKLPIFIELAQDAIENGHSVAIFVNYIETMQQLCFQLKTDCTISGAQSLAERVEAIKDFQSNKKKVIVAIITAGGVGVSLHDIHGGHPRMSIISPTWSGQDTAQVLGRIYRANAKSPAIQRLVYVAKTYEERICEIIDNKLKNLAGINDGDLVGPKFDKQIIEEYNKLVEHVEEK